jgi:hypothetical protein
MKVTSRPTDGEKTDVLQEFFRLRGQQYGVHGKPAASGLTPIDRYVLCYRELVVLSHGPAGSSLERCPI